MVANGNSEVDIQIRKKQEDKTKKSAEQEESMRRTPFSGRRVKLKNSPGVPWVKTTPALRMPPVNEEEGNDLQPELPQPPAAPSFAPEMKEKIEELKRTMGSGFIKELEDIIVAAATAAPSQPVQSKPIITHGDVNKVAQARKQLEKAKSDLREIDEEWKSFAQGLQTAYEREQADYKVLRKSALEEVHARLAKLKELLEAIKQSALLHGRRRFRTGRGGCLYQLPEAEDLEVPPDGEELIQAMEDSNAFHQAKVFGKFSASPVRKAEVQDGSRSKKLRASNSQQLDQSASAEGAK